jgi:hypothetical protein
MKKPDRLDLGLTGFLRACPKPAGILEQDLMTQNFGG